MCLFITVALLASCTVGGDSGSSDSGSGNSGTQGSGDSSTDGGSDNTGGAGTGDTDGGAKPSAEAIFGAGISTKIIRGAGDSDSEFLQLIIELKNKIGEKTDGSATLDDDVSASGEHEIVIGDTDRAISASAERALSRALRAASRKEEYQDEVLLAFTVYAEGSSAAIVWNDERIAEWAIEYFAENYLGSGSLILEDGYSHSRTVTLLEYYAALDAEGLEAEWAAVEATLGEDAAEALKGYYTLFDDRLYLWLADLYDPVSGGFYCTSAARDNQGFLPDIQSTAQALAFLNNSGMTKDFGGWEYALPAEITDAIAEFAKSLQSPVDGYFYHPQWEGLTYTASRLGRDVTWAGEILKPLYALYSARYAEAGYSEDEAKEMLKKYMPYWDTPGGQKGSLGKPDGGSVGAVSYMGVTLPLSSARCSAARAAASTVIAVAGSSTWTPQLRSLEAWEAYLYGGTVDGVTYEGFDLEEDSYTPGNALNAQMSQILERDKEAARNGERTGYVDLTMKLLDGSVKAHNGLWEEELSYNAVNGLMKILTVYNGMNRALPYPDKAMSSAIAVATLSVPDSDGKEPTAAVDVYNPWVCISGIFTNVSKYNKTLDRQEFESVWRTEVTESAADMIKGTASKIAKFAKTDGSYGYHWGAPPVNAQGMPVTVSGVVCGDVDGACLCSTGSLSRMCEALGLLDYPSLFGSYDMEIFSRRLLGLGEIIKNYEEDTDVYVYDFEDGVAGVDYPEVEGVIHKLNSRAVSEHNSATEENRLMLTVTDGNPELGIASQFKSLGVASDKASCYILEFDIYIEDIEKGDYMEIKVGTADSAAYMMTLEATDGSRMSMGDNSGSIKKSFGKSFGSKQWHNIRIEYYVGSASEVVIKNFLDGALIYNSNNYYGRKTGEVVEPDPVYDMASIYSTYPSTMVFHLDNVIAEKSTKKYVPEAVYNPNRVKDFEGEGMPTGVKAQDSQLTADPLGGPNRVLKANGTVTVSTTEHLTPANVFVYDSDVYIPSSAPDGSLATLYMTSNTVGESLYALTFSAVTEGEKRLVRLSVTTKEGVTDKVVGYAPIGEKFHLRVEYYRYQYNEDYSKIQSIVYINGKESGRSDVGYYLYNVPRDYAKLIFKTASGAEVYLDNLIAENDRISFRDASGKLVADPKNPVFPTGGQGASTAPDKNYIGRIDFEGSALGVPKIPGLETKPNSNEFGNDIEVAADPTGAKNNALLVSTVPSARAGNFVRVSPYEVDPDANCYVLEWDMYITAGSIPYYQIKVGDCFTLELRGSTTLRILTKSSNPTDGSGRIESILGKGHKLTEDEWHTLRIEYYCGTAETVKILVYVDGSVYETTHFYGKGTNVVGTPSNLYDESNVAVFYSGYDCSADVYFDNITAEKIVKEYVSPTPEEPEGGEGGEGTEPENPTPDTPTPDTPITPEGSGGEISIDTSLVGDGAPRPGDMTGNWIDPNG